MEVLHSYIDPSVNFIIPHESGGILEARYVERGNKAICYLSSHTGCNKACRMCHLTQTNQTDFIEAKLIDYIKQANTVYEYMCTKDLSKLEKINFNFMARGEPLANSTVTGKSKLLFDGLRNFFGTVAPKCDIKISTIMPQEMLHKNLYDMFDSNDNIDIYYSLYSMDEKFRKKWLPKSIDPDLALTKLYEYNKITGNEVTLHWAFIKGENDSEKDVSDILRAIARHNLFTRFNHVAYNPFENKSEESDPEQIEKLLGMIGNYMPVKSVDRVGFDVKASCGMFV